MGTGLGASGARSPVGDLGWCAAAEQGSPSGEGRKGRLRRKVAGLTPFPGCVLSRMISLSREYALKRVVFGKLLKDHPLHMQTIARLEVRLPEAELILLVRKEGRDPQPLVGTASLPLRASQM